MSRSHGTSIARSYLLTGVRLVLVRVEKIHSVLDWVQFEHGAGSPLHLIFFFRHASQAYMSPQISLDTTLAVLSSTNEYQRVYGSPPWLFSSTAVTLLHVPWILYPLELSKVFGRWFDIVKRLCWCTRASDDIFEALLKYFGAEAEQPPDYTYFSQHSKLVIESNVWLQSQLSVWTLQAVVEIMKQREIKTHYRARHQMWACIRWHSSRF